MLIVHLFVSYAHVNLCHFFFSSWCQGLAATSACGSSWTFLFTFLQVTRVKGKIIPASTMYFIGGSVNESIPDLLFIATIAVTALF